MTHLKNKVLLITGATRGIGLAVAKRAAQDGAKIVVLGKTTQPHATLPGTIYSAAEEIVKAGGSAIGIPCDIRFEASIQTAVEQAIAAFGGIDIVVNNASAIDLRNIDELDIKKFDLMHEVNARGTYLVSKLCLPHLRKSSNPHILTMSPPLDMQSKWFSPHLGYTMAKFGMSMVTLGLAHNLKDQGIAVNSLWPETLIDTAAISNLGNNLSSMSRDPSIVADAAYIILTKPSNECTGNFFIDSQVLQQAGVESLDKYAVDPSQMQLLDLFLDAAITKNVMNFPKKPQ